MDLIKKLTGKNPDEYNIIAKLLVNNADINLFADLVKQDDFLFDFVKNNVAKRIQNACTQENYKNLIKFFEFYSPSYDTMIAEVLYKYGGLNILPSIKEIYMNGNPNQKAYAVKYFSLLGNDNIQDILPELRIDAKSDFEYLALNAIEVLAKLNDEISKTEALQDLKSGDEFTQYSAIKFLVNYQAKDAVSEIIDVMKTSSLSENIASEIPYLISSDELLEKDYENGVLVLCNIVNAIPDIIPVSAILDYNLYSVLDNLNNSNLNSASATLLMIAKNKFQELTSNEEYLFDCDKNTKDAVITINNMLKKINGYKLKSLLYEELFDESNFVFYAIDYVEEKEVLESLLDSTNQTLLLKILSMLKEKFTLENSHKLLALKNITDAEIKTIVEAM